MLFTLIILTFSSLFTLDNPEDCQQPVPTYFLSFPITEYVNLKECFGLQVNEKLIQSGSYDKMPVILQKKKKMLRQSSG